MFKRKSKTLKRLYIFLLILGMIFVSAVIPLFWIYYHPEEGLEKKSAAAFFDVGQGDAALLKTPFGQNILIDGGPDKNIIQKLEKELPWWDRKIDLMILTHPHDDHVAGLIEVLGKYQVNKILYTGVTHNSPAYLEWLKIIRAKHIPLIIIDRPQGIVFGENCLFDILYPRESFLGKGVSNLNNSSIVGNFICGDKSILFMGDAESELENELSASGADISARVLKAGHHGSDTSSSDDFIRLVNPRQVIISVGKENKFGHPNLRIIRRMERLGAEILRTDVLGTIRIGW